MVWFWLVLVFMLGACLGSFLNVCIYRLPLEKSILWPGSHCGHCLQPIRWYDNIPLLSYWLLRGRCRSCGSRFSMQYFLIELLTGLSFAGLFYVEVLENVHGFPALRNARADLAQGVLPSAVAWIVWGHHALLVCFLMVASVCDLGHREIPLSVTVTGTLIGLVGAVLWPWPWPLDAAQGALPVQHRWLAGQAQPIQTGLYLWPVWGPLPDWLPPGSWQLGLATGLAGMAVGTLMLRVIRFVFGLGLGIEALGLGDADLMMMAGSFLGWQPVVVGFFLGVFLGLFFGIFQLVFRGDNAMAFGPALSLALVGTFLGWRWIGPEVQPLLFNDTLLLILAGLGCVLMLAASYVLRRLLRLMRPPPPDGPDGVKGAV